MATALGCYSDIIGGLQCSKCPYDYWFDTVVGYKEWHIACKYPVLEILCIFLGHVEDHVGRLGEAESTVLLLQVAVV